MSEQSFEELFNESYKQIHTGEAVEGTVIDVKPDSAILDIGYKSEGILTRNEYTNDSSVDLTDVLHEGDTLEVKPTELLEEPSLPHLPRPVEDQGLATRAVLPGYELVHESSLHMTSFVKNYVPNFADNNKIKDVNL
jgi:hypothetical protein